MITDNFVLTLGTAQDGGYPHIGCFENCCLRVIKNPNHKRFIASLAIVDNENKTGILYLEQNGYSEWIKNAEEVDFVRMVGVLQLLYDTCSALKEEQEEED